MTLVSHSRRHYLVAPRHSLSWYQRRRFPPGS